MQTTPTGGVKSDGRRLRREQNRELVIDALLDLFTEGVYEPGSAEIAGRAGLSPRSLFRYFDDVDDLNRAAIARQQRRALPLLDPGVSPDAPTAEKIEAIATARVRLFETIAPAARAARACSHRHAVVHGELRQNRRYLREQLRVLFTREMEGREDVVLPGLDALCSFETYELLRSDQQLSRAKTIAAMVFALGAMLDDERSNR